jgi:hypothetical protein
VALPPGPETVLRQQIKVPLLKKDGLNGLHVQAEFRDVLAASHADPRESARNLEYAAFGIIRISAKQVPDLE